MFFEIFIKNMVKLNYMYMDLKSKSLTSYTSWIPQMSYSPMYYTSKKLIILKYPGIDKVKIIQKKEVKKGNLLH